MSTMQKAFAAAGITKEVKKRKKKYKDYACYKCGEPMHRDENTNVLVCTNDKCNNYYIFK
jgi:formylmethanofuran dehydrogenase subunit E